MQVIKLNDGYEIPQVGLGLWQIKDEVQFDEAFRVAWEAGYRHFDSAQVYGNEQMLGNAIRKMGINREKLFVTTKIAVQQIALGRAKGSLSKSFERLQLDYIDLVLLHFPALVGRKKAWQALEESKAEGKVRSIGVSNYTIRHLEEMKKYARVMPAVNQVELHVFLQQPELLEYCEREGIVVEAYSPLAHAKDMDEQVIERVATKHGVSYAQVMLRWCLQKGLVVLPKSVTPERIRENIDIFGFELDASDMQELAKLNRNLRTCWDPTHVP